MKRILLQLDTDSHPSVFDSVVAIDAGAEVLLPQGSVSEQNVRALVHGTMFTRGPKDLKSTAIFIGGTDVAAGEAVLSKVRSEFFGPMRVSVMMDSNGSNTTACAAVLCARKHLDLSGTTATVLAGTGPVGLRAAQLLAAQGATVRVGSRSLERSMRTCDRLSGLGLSGSVAPTVTGTDAETLAACQGAQLVIAAGAAGAQLLSAASRRTLKELRVAIDVNAVPPLGLEGVEAFDKGTDRDGVSCYGALGVGGLKMKIHKAAIAKLFESNDAVLDTDAIFRIGLELG